LGQTPLVSTVGRKLVGEGRGNLVVSLLEEVLSGSGAGGGPQGGQPRGEAEAMALKEILAAAYYQSEALEQAKEVSPAGSTVTLYGNTA
jgi:hypothetical protein